MALYLLGAVACTSSSERRGAVEAFDGPSPTGRALQTWPWLYKLNKIDNFFPPEEPALGLGALDLSGSLHVGGG